MNLEGKWESQHFVVTKNHVSIRFEGDQQAEMMKYLQESKEPWELFLIITYNTTDSVKKWIEGELNKEQANNNMSVA